MWQSTDSEILRLLATGYSAVTGSTTIGILGSGTAMHSTISNPNSNNSQNTHSLSQQARAGIAMGVVAVCIVFVIGVFFYFRSRGQKRKRLLEGKAGSSDAHKLFTNADTHELLTKHNVPEMNRQNSGQLQSRTVTRIVDWNEGGERQVLFDLNQDTHIFQVKTFNSPGDNIQELDTSPPNLSSMRIPVASHVVDTISVARPDTRRESAIQEQAKNEEAKLQALNDRIEKIRLEKQRLQRIQELEEMEEQTKQQIMSAQGRGIESSGLLGS